MSPVSPDPNQRPPHPLAVSLIERLRGNPAISVLEVGAGSGRNTRALEAAGFRVVSLGGGRADAALSTHALLHGTLQSIAETLDGIATQLRDGAPLYGTFGSVKDARYGSGHRHGAHSFAPLDGDERGVIHTYFDEARLRELLTHRFNVDSLEEQRIDEVAGSWAHQERPLAGAFHWFAVACCTNR